MKIKNLLLISTLCVVIFSSLYLASAADKSGVLFNRPFDIISETNLDIDLFDGNHNSCYNWDNHIDYWIYINYTGIDAAESVSIDTIKPDSEQTFDIPAECYEQDILQVYFEATNKAKCWDGTQWISFGTGFAGADKSQLCEISLNQVSLVDVPTISLNSPANLADSVSINPTLRADFTDESGNPLTFTFYDASDNSVIPCTITNTGSQATGQWTGLEYNTQYSWYATIDNTIYQRTSATWTFTTSSGPTVELVFPTDNEIDVSIATPLVAEFNTFTGENIDVTFYNADSGQPFDMYFGEWYANNGEGYAIWFLNYLEYSKVYNWYAIVNDGINDPVQSDTFTFTTTSNNIPQVNEDEITPLNGATGQPLDVQLKVNVFDDDAGETIDAKFYNYPEGVSISNIFEQPENYLLHSEDNLASGSEVTYTWSGLAYSTTYRWLVDLNDSTDNGNIYLFEFTTQPAPSSPGSPGSGTTPNTGGGGPTTFYLKDTKTFANLKEGASRAFRIDTDIHTLKINNVREDEVDVTINSEPVKLTLQINKSQEINIDDDSANDIRVTLIDIDNNNRVDVKLDLIAEPEQTPEEQPEEEEETPEEQPEETEVTGPAEETDLEQTEGGFDTSFITGAFAGLSGDMNASTWTLISIIVIVIILYALVRKQGKLLKSILRGIFGVKKRKGYIRNN